MENQDLIEVLAHLDSIVEGPKLWSLQDANTNEQIYRILIELADKLGNRFTVEQIKTCLLREYENGEAYPEYNFSRVFLHGSSEMRELDPQTRILVKQRLSQIYTSPGYQIPRRKRPRFFYKPPEKVFKRKSRFSATPGQLSTRSTTSSNSTIAVQRNHARKGKFCCEVEYPSTSISRRYHTRSMNVITTIERNKPPSISVSTAGSTVSPINSSPLSSVPSSPWPSPGSPTVTDRITACRKNREETGSCSSIDSSYFDLLAELSYHKRCHEVADRERSFLEREHQHIERLCEVAKGNPEKILKKLCEKSRQISISNRQFNDRMKLEPYLTIRDTPEELPTTPDLSSTFKAMRHQLSSIMVLGSAEMPSITSLYHHSEDLDMLLNTAFVGDNPYTTTESLDISPALMPDEIIKALTGAAIHRWVFENDYTCPVMMITPMVQKYRDHIATLYGNERLCDLDTAVHQSIVKENSFTDVTIPRMATKLSNRLLNALQPLLNQQLRDKKIEKLRPLLYSILTSAIRIRSLSLIGSEVYESIWPLCSSPFNSTLMEEESPEKNIRIDSIRVALSPGLRAYRKEQGMVHYYGFNHDEKSSMTAHYTIKALVLV